MRGSRAVAAAAVGACAACLALAIRAGADEPRVGLIWNAPNACPTEGAVRANVAGLLAGSTAAVEGRADVSRLGERWQVLVTVNGGERRLEADSCHALADATALIVAMAVDPARVVANRSAHDAGVDAPSPPDASAPDASPDAPTPELPAASSSTPPARPTPLPPSTPLPPPAFSLSASASADLGTLPTVSAGPSVALAWLPPRARLELSAAYFPSSTASPSPLVSGQLALVSLALRACYQARLASFDLGPCGGFEGGFLWVNLPSGEGHGSAPLFAPEVGAGPDPNGAQGGPTDASVPTDASPAPVVDAGTVSEDAGILPGGSIGADGGCDEDAGTSSTYDGGTAGMCAPCPSGWAQDSVEPELCCQTFPNGPTLCFSQATGSATTGSAGTEDGGTATPPSTGWGTAGTTEDGGTSGPSCTGNETSCGCTNDVGGHTYALDCSSASGAPSCTCTVDGVATSSVPIVGSCEDSTAVTGAYSSSSGCGFP